MPSFALAPQVWRAALSTAPVRALLTSTCPPKLRNRYRESRAEQRRGQGQGEVKKQEARNPRAAAMPCSSASQQAATTPPAETAP